MVDVCTAHVGQARVLAVVLSFEGNPDEISARPLTLFSMQSMHAAYIDS